MRKSVGRFTLEILRRCLLGILSVVIFFESCKKYEFPGEERYPVDRRIPFDDSYLTRTAIQLSSEDIAYWRGLDYILQQVLANPQWAEAYLELDEVEIPDLEGAFKVDNFTKGLIRLFMNQDLRNAIYNKDYGKAIVIAQEAKKGMKVSTEMEDRIRQLLLSNPQWNSGLDADVLRVPHEQLVFFIAVLALVLAGVVATVGAAVSAWVVALCEVKVLPCENVMDYSNQNPQLMAMALMAGDQIESLKLIEEHRATEMNRLLEQLIEVNPSLGDESQVDQIREILNSLL